MGKNIISPILLIVLLIAPVSAHAGVPLETVKGHVDKVLDVLRDTSLKGESMKKIKKEKIRFISEKMFDFTELSRRTLGQNWIRFTTEQQQEFIELYKSILEGAYIGTNAQGYSTNEVLYGLSA